MRNRLTSWWWDLGSDHYFYLQEMKQNRYGEYQYEQPLTFFGFWVRYRVLLYPIRAYGRLVCYFTSHNLVDNDPGDCEVGPQPDVYCTRCGKQFR